MFRTKNCSSGRSLAGRLAIGGVIAATVALSGCYTEGGPGISLNQHVYVSTPLEPKTVSVIDAATRQTFWSIDVPVGKKLVMRIYKGEGKAGTGTPDLMKWAIIDKDDEWGQLPNMIAIPSTARIDWDYRPAPELPDATVTSSAPAAKPAPASTPKK